jgi:ABC-type molybdate transport system substrate-binding protein
MRLLRVLIPAGLLVSILLLTTTLSVAKPEYTKKEKKGCTVCHVAAAKKDLNDVGKCYETKKSLDTCEPKKK